MLNSQPASIHLGVAWEWGYTHIPFYCHFTTHSFATQYDCICLQNVFLPLIFKHSCTGIHIAVCVHSWRWLTINSPTAPAIFTPGSHVSSTPQASWSWKTAVLYTVYRPQQISLTGTGCSIIAAKTEQHCLCSYRNQKHITWSLV